MSSNGANGQPPVVANADEALAFIEDKLPGIDALSAVANQRYRDNGELYDVIDIAWKMRPALVADFAANVDGAENAAAQASVTANTYYSHEDANGPWRHRALHAIVVKANKVLSIYAGLPVVAHYYTDPGADPPPLPIPFE